MAGGRPSDYTPELALNICLRIAGGDSLRKICSEEGMPHRDTVHTWLLTKTEFSDQYARAREAQADVMFDDCLAIADDSSQDMKLVEGDGPPVEVVNHEHISRSKLRVDTRKWIAGKLAPKRYGERVALTGPDNGPIQTVDKTPGASKAKVLDDLRDIFTAALIPGPIAADGEPAADAAGNDPVVRDGAVGGSATEPGASAPGEAVAVEE